LSQLMYIFIFYFAGSHIQHMFFDTFLYNWFFDVQTFFRVSKMQILTLCSFLWVLIFCKIEFVNYSHICLLSLLFKQAKKLEKPDWQKK
jgi:hypothetical protein